MAIKNLASGTLVESVSASATTLLVYVGNGSSSTIQGVWPTPPFYATIMPSNPTAGVANSLDSEIVKVTAVGNDQDGNTVLTVVRGEKGSNTQAFAEGAIVTNANYAEEAVLLGDEETAETPTPWVESDMIDWTTMQSSAGTQGYKRADFGKLHLLIIPFYVQSGARTVDLSVPSDWVSNANQYNSVAMARHYFTNNADGRFGAYWWSNGQLHIYQVSSSGENEACAFVIGYW